MGGGLYMVIEHVFVHVTVKCYIKNGLLQICHFIHRSIQLSS